MPPWVEALRVLSRREDGLTAEMAVGYGGLRERYTSDVALDPVQHRIDVVQTKGPFKTLENHWRFTPKGDGCEVVLSIAVVSCSNAPPVFEATEETLDDVSAAVYAPVERIRRPARCG